MFDAVFQHRRKVRNTGDLVCSPGLYLDFGRSQLLDFSEPLPPSRLAVFGGGQVFDECLNAVVYRAPEARHRVIWGVGIDGRAVRSLSFDIMAANCALVSSRNWGVRGCEYVPCASALSPLFDAPPPAPKHEVVLFSHARKSAQLARPEGIPVLDNGQADFAAAIDFIASGETVVTNSYHGTYWAMCLGRRVLSVPFSDKFRQFRDNPVFADPQDWPQMLARAEVRPGTLEEARARNLAFYDKVRNLD